jgi:archaeal type IV pilus assembly protein PilA
MNYNKIIRKFKKNSKGLSPVVASIILIAVTVAVSVVVAAWMGGMTIGLMGNAEQATITNLDFSDAANGNIIATVQNTGNADVTVTAAYINGQAVDPAFVSSTIAKSATHAYTLATDTTALASGDYTVKITTAGGNNLVLTATYAP